MRRPTAASKSRLSYRCSAASWFISVHTPQPDPTARAQAEPIIKYALNGGDVPEIDHASISCGGGYGPPHERAPEKVLHDVREKWISRERARDIYLVAITDDLKVDAAATAELRAKVAQAAE